MYQSQFWVLRQNPCANTNQEQMRNFIITQQFVTCPFGHISNARNNVLNGRYNESIVHFEDLDISHYQFCHLKI